MAFSKEIKDTAYGQAGGRCECTMTDCGHKGRCNKSLASGWHAHHRHSLMSGGGDTLSNCLAMCVPCHKNTKTYGG